MLTFTTDKNILEIKLDWRTVSSAAQDGMFTIWTFTHPLPEKHDALAAVAMRQVHNAFAELIQKIRREAYEQGYKDAKAKARKKDTFSCVFRAGVHSGGAF